MRKKEFSIIEDKDSERVGDSKDEMLIGNIEKVVERRGNPLISSDGTTGRAETRFTGMRDSEHSATVKALIFMKS